MERLGEGGMGVVYRARDPQLEREVAVKVVSPEHLTGIAAERLRREARVIAQMSHPGVVQVHDIGSDDEQLFFVMPVL